MPVCSLSASLKGAVRNAEPHPPPNERDTQGTRHSEVGTTLLGSPPTHSNLILINELQAVSSQSTASPSLGMGAYWNYDLRMLNLPINMKAP